MSKLIPAVVSYYKDIFPELTAKQVPTTLPLPYALPRYLLPLSPTPRIATALPATPLCCAACARR
eukprot:31409-Rhodomonas_salina.1